MRDFVDDLIDAGLTPRARCAVVPPWVGEGLTQAGDGSGAMRMPPRDPVEPEDLRVFRILPADPWWLVIDDVDPAWTEAFGGLGKVMGAGTGVVVRHTDAAASDRALALMGEALRRLGLGTPADVRHAPRGGPEGRRDGGGPSSEGGRA